MPGYFRLLSLWFLLILSPLFSQDKEVQLSPWQDGILEIHHINTGRGDAAFCILPDGTTLLIDAGDMSETHPRTLSARNAKAMPNNSKSAPEWILDYIEQFLPKENNRQLDYALMTHYHDDHFGEMDANRKISDKGGYALTGITEVGHYLPIKTLLDRGSDYPIDVKDVEIQKKIDKDDAYGMIGTLKNYWQFIDHHSKTNGLKHETLQAGKLNQICLKNTPEGFPNFAIRNIAVNGTIWSGEDDGVIPLFSMGEYPGENSLSTVKNFVWRFRLLYRWRYKWYRCFWWN